MTVANICSGVACTKACLAPRIIKHIKEEGYLPILLSPCRNTPGTPYWIWANRYQGDLVVIDVDAPKYPHITTKWKKPAVHMPIDIVAQIVRWMDVGSDLTNMALVQRSWCHPAQSELFGTVILKCPIRTQLFVEAFVRNIGPGNPLRRMGVDRVHLENFVRHIYVDIPENYTQGRFYGNLVTILPLLRNLRSLYLVMRRWNDHIWDVELGKFLPEHAPPTLNRLCIEIPAGDPNALLFARRPDINRWRSWFSAWKHIRILAFVCEDVWWHRSSNTPISQASQVAEKVVREWLANASTSLECFELWSGADSLQLSRQLQVAYARFHNIHKTEPTRHRYSFKRDENTRTWALSPAAVLMRSAVSQFREHVCVDGCWICLAMEEDEDADDVISYLDDIRQEDWQDRILDMTLWSQLDRDSSYKLSM